HPILTREQFVFAARDRKPNVQLLSNGARELMALVSGDAGYVWQTNRTAASPELFRFAADLSQYTTEHQYHIRHDTHVITADPAVKATQSLKVARLKYGGNWDP